MENLKVSLRSGAQLLASLGSFSEGHRLYKAVTRELSRYNLAEGTAENLAMVMTSSEDVDTALWPCLERATYTPAGQTSLLKINQGLFENAEYRSDLLEIQREVLGYNLIPFSLPVGSLLLAALKKDIGALKQNAP